MTTPTSLSLSRARARLRPLLLLPLLLAGSSALAAGKVYFNDIEVNPLSLRGNTFTEVTVTVDASGDIRIDAPRYKIEVQGVAGTTADAEPIAAGRYWLVTQDNGSSGHVIDLIVNNTRVRTLSSGEGQVILDLAPFLKKGDNTVVMNAQPGAVRGGGDLIIYIGQGNNDSGTVTLTRPDVRYVGKAADSSAGGSRSFTLTIP